MSYKRGDVVLVFFPDSNLRTAKRRPALVVQADNLNTGLQQTIVAMITSNLSRADHNSRVRLLRDSPEGLLAHILMDSVIMTDNLATIIDNEVDRVLGHLNEMSKVDAALRSTLAV
jgi:mRNA interferase MazF